MNSDATAEDEAEAVPLQRTGDYVGLGRRVTFTFICVRVEAKQAPFSRGRFIS